MAVLFCLKLNFELPDHIIWIKERKSIVWLSSDSLENRRDDTYNEKNIIRMIHLMEGNDTEIQGKHL